MYNNREMNKENKKENKITKSSGSPDDMHNLVRANLGWGFQWTDVFFSKCQSATRSLD